MPEHDPTIAAAIRRLEKAGYYSSPQSAPPADPLVEASAAVLAAPAQLDEGVQKFGGSCASCRTGFHLFVFDLKHAGSPYDARICPWCGNKALTIGRT